MDYIRLDGAKSTFVLDTSGNGIPYCTYWGSRLENSAVLEHIHISKAVPTFPAGLDAPHRLNLFPEHGTGFRGKPALLGHRNGKHWATLFQFKNVVRLDNSLELRLLDPAAMLELILDCQLDPDTGILRRRTHLINLSSLPYQLEYCAAAAIAIPSFCTELLTFHGGWTGEFMLERTPFVSGIKLFENRTGRTSHEVFPGMIAGSPGFSENSGSLYGIHLGWSGNSRLFAEVIPDGDRQIQMGELLAPGEVILRKLERYTSPWAYAGISGAGLNDLSHSFHHFIRKKIMPDKVYTASRPVQFNSWEAVYFDHDLKKLKALAAAAAALGMERYVLDDGWFHHRSDAARALGDWWPDSEKYPQGLAPLIDYVNSLGMSFGLWVEPEMVNPVSELYRQHPDWILNIPHLPNLSARNQYVLDLCRKEVRDDLYAKLDLLLSTYNIAFLKWDMNRTLTMAAHNEQPAYHRQTMAFYQLVDTIRQAHPNVEIETCASGGGRIDFEILQRTERFWASDSNDPFRRQTIQKGCSLFFPPEITGSHIGPAESHTSGRVSDMLFRAQTAFFCHFGCEFNLLEMSVQERQQLSQYISLHKYYRKLIHSGRYIRLALDSQQRNGYGVVSSNKEAALFCVIQLNIPDQVSARTIRFSHLDPDVTYRVKLLQPLHNSIEKMLPNRNRWFDGFDLPGRVLLDEGLSIYMPWPGTGVLIEFVKSNPP